MYVQVIGRPLRFVCGKQPLVGGETLFVANVAERAFRSLCLIRNVSQITFHLYESGV